MNAPTVETIGRFAFDSRMWTVEVHTGTEIWVTHDGNTAAKMFIAGEAAQLGPLVPVGQAAPWDWLSGLQSRVLDTVQEAGKSGYGPWAWRYRWLWDD